MTTSRILHGVLTDPIPCGIRGCPVCDRDGFSDPRREPEDELEDEEEEDLPEINE